ncbi:MAG TPA: hypothetical protein VLT57_18245 [Bryobacteraceae bacterium]|mgnify:FL=1|jgi:hypothetical protein|nr:hypothetical protein [Bryobacteraceae bacterium]
MKRRIGSVIVFAAVALAAGAEAQNSQPASPKKPVPQSVTAANPPATTRSKPASKAKPQPAHKAAPAVGAFKPAGAVHKGTDGEIPKGATQVDATSWRWTDAKGTAWIYRKTPFGFSRYREEDEKQRAMTQRAEVNPPKVTDAGDSYQFERTTPFGVQSWKKKKDSLTDSEKNMVKEAGAPTQGKGQQ